MCLPAPDAMMNVIYDDSIFEVHTQLTVARTSVSMEPKPQRKRKDNIAPPSSVREKEHINTGRENKERKEPHNIQITVTTCPIQLRTGYESQPSAQSSKSSRVIPGGHFKKISLEQ